MIINNNRPQKSLDIVHALQYQRDIKVENAIVAHLRDRVTFCTAYYKDEWAKRCKKVIDDYIDTQDNYFIKYGELGCYTTVIDAYMKQKHRMIWERRNPDKVDNLYGKKYTGNRYYSSDVVMFDRDRAKQDAEMAKRKAEQAANNEQ